MSLLFFAIQKRKRPALFRKKLTLPFRKNAVFLLGKRFPLFSLFSPIYTSSLLFFLLCESYESLLSESLLYNSELIRSRFFTHTVPHFSLTSFSLYVFLTSSFYLLYLLFLWEFCKWINRSEFSLFSSFYRMLFWCSFLCFLLSSLRSIFVWKTMSCDSFIWMDFRSTDG